ncbi:hypothetical protein I552_1660 [Mycobacterium xenopi 3993]|nr:hypothetical protein I552_1660 [Mycobacterium xenopi 3993]
MLRPAAQDFNSVGVVFKGSGFYRTDSRESAKSSTNGSGEKSSSESTASEKNSSTEKSSASSSTAAA